MSVELRPARVNTFAAEGKDHLLHVVRKEREDFYDVIDSTDDETWKTQTACTEWEIRDVVGHLVDVTEGYIERFGVARIEGTDLPPPVASFTELALPSALVSNWRSGFFKKLFEGCVSFQPAARNV